MTRAELEALGWHDAKLDELYAENVRPIVDGQRLAADESPDAPTIRIVRRERFDAVCAALYLSNP